MNKRIYIAGHRGLVGSALMRRLSAEPNCTLITRTSKQLDLRNQAEVHAFFAKEQPQHIYLAAAKVGGIHANNTYRAEFLYDNLMIAANVIHAAYQHTSERLLFLGSSCIYPRLAPQPMPESCLLTGPLEPTNEPYAIAKIAGLKMVENYNRQYGTNFISAMPTNLYGPGDNFDLENSHVLPAMIRKFHEAKIAGAPAVTLWGDGSPRREFLHADDCADACVFLMNKVQAGMVPGDMVNVGCGEDVSIKELADMVAQTVGYTGDIVWDTSKPKGTPRKLQDVHTLHTLGWHAQRPLVDGLASTYAWFTTQPSKP